MLPRSRTPGHARFLTGLSALAADAGLAWAPLPTPRQGAERVALEVRRERRDQGALHSAERVYFLLPLAGKHQVGDWQVTCRRLEATLKSFEAQTDRRWSAVVCGQDCPDFLAGRVIGTLTSRHLRQGEAGFIEFPVLDPGPDKWAKLGQLADFLAAGPPLPGYVMGFDGDDLAHPKLVAEMLERQAPGGYVVEDGFIFDVGGDCIGRACRPRLRHPRARPFWKLCGSCVALRVDAERRPGSLRLLRAMLEHEHRMFPWLAWLAGQRLHPLERAFVVYILNHGENFGPRRGRTSFKGKYARRFALSEVERTALIRSWPALSQQITLPD